MKNSTQITILEATKERNGVIAKKISANGNLSSCELRKISISGRDNGYIASVNSSGAVVVTGTSWRGKIANSPVSNLEELVSGRLEEIKAII